MWSGRRDSNPRPSPWQGMPTCSTDLRKHTETASDLPFQLITGSRWFALSCDVSRPVRGLLEDHSGDPPRVTPRIYSWVICHSFELQTLGLQTVDSAILVEPNLGRI